ncbi:DNA polymerase III subunit chi [Halomonadaceae bacterium KBTZ08]
MSHWFHILAGTGRDARLLHAARLAEKAWLDGDRVALYCDDATTAEALDAMLWSFRPESFLPHERIRTSDQQPDTRVTVLECDPAPGEWDTLIVVATTLPGAADRFARLALIASNEDSSLQRARAQYRQLRELGITPQVHDFRSPG